MTFDSSFSGSVVQVESGLSYCVIVSVFGVDIHSEAAASLRCLFEQHASDIDAVWNLAAPPLSVATASDHYGTSFFSEC